MIDSNRFEKRLKKYSKSRAGGLTDLSLLAALEGVAEELPSAMCLDGGPENFEELDYELAKAWNTLLLTLEKIHNNS